VPTELAVLLVEDSEDDALLIARALRQGGYEPRITRVETIAALEDALARGACDVVLADFRLGGFSGFDALDIVRRRGADVPFLFVSGQMGEETAVEAMRLGAQDYVMKGNLNRLAPAVARELGEAAVRARAREAERETRATQARLAEILRIAADAIISVDEAQRITAFNRGAETIFGYAAPEVLGKALALLLPERYVAAHEGHVRVFGAGDDGARRMGERAEVYGRRKDGTEFPAEASISRLHTEHGWVYTAILRDVTERHAAEARLAAYAGELERRNRELQEYAYAAAHDLRAPLRGIVSFAQLLRTQWHELPSARRNEYVEYIEAAAARLQRLLEALLEVDRVSRESRPLRRVALDAAVDGACAQLRDALERSHAQIARGPLPAVHGDEALLILLLQNLIENAIKFTRPGEAPRIEIEASALPGGCEITVRDDGIGLDPETAAQAFELFRRLHPDDGRPGTGLGLAICRRIVEDRHGGRIWLESDGRRGTTVRFVLPDTG
jgi:PAS domain S-box-containing protein